MSCHVLCPRCHTKFFKISNMSVPAIKKESSIKPCHVERKPRKSSSAELENALCANEQLENINRSLKSEIFDLRIKNDNLMKVLKCNRQKFEHDFAKLQEEIKLNESVLIDTSRKCLEQQKKYVEEVKKVKEENEDLKKKVKMAKVDAEIAFTERLKSLESEIKLLKLANDNLKEQSEENAQKCLKYKTKLKHAVKIVNEMNNLVVHYDNKPTINCETTQTECEITGGQTKLLDCSQCGDPIYKRNINSENLLLSDIFFKQKTFCDSELDLFSSKSKSSSS